jgi:di/tricarboxylate transporter
MKSTGAPAGSRDRLTDLQRAGLQPCGVLMPLAFALILGGMTTLIGPPPHLIVSGFRAKAGGAGFGVFDFTPVGLAVATPALRLFW